MKDAIVDCFKFFFYYCRTQKTSKSNALALVSNEKIQRSEKSAKNAKTNKRKRDEEEILKADCAPNKTEAFIGDNTNKIVSKSNTVNCELRCRLRSQTGILSKEKQPTKKVSLNEENSKTESAENVEENVPIQKRYAIDSLVKSLKLFFRNLI